MIRILIVDDANLIRQALTIYFELESDLEIVGIAENGKIALKLIEEFKPDIVLMDMEMPEMDGLTATEIIHQRFPQTKVLMISSHHSQEHIDKSLKAGANGYFIKNMPTEELLEAIKLIYKQDVTIIPMLSQEAGYTILQNSFSPTKSKSRFASLPLPHLNKLLSSLNHLLKQEILRKRITIVYIFGLTIFLATVAIKYKMAVRADVQIYDSLENYEMNEE